MTFEMGSGESYTVEEILAAHPPVLVPRPVPPSPRPPTGRSVSADDDEIVLDLAPTLRRGVPGPEGDRHASAIAVATYMRKLGCTDSEVRTVVGIASSRPGKRRTRRRR